MGFLKKSKWLQGLLRGLNVTFVASFATMSGLSAVANQWSSYVDEALGTSAFQVVTGEAAEGQDLYPFKSDFSTTSELIAYKKDLGERIGAEGTVLLKNSNNVLPLPNTSKITLFGLASRAPIMGGQIGSSYPGKDDNDKYHLGANTNAETSYNLINTLRAEGYTLNPDMIQVYNTYNKTQNNLAGTFRNVEYENRYQSNEASPATLATVEGWASAELSIANYNDAAFVVLSRPASEGRDYYPGADAVGTGYRNVLNGDPTVNGEAAAVGSDAYATGPLALNNAEKDLLDYVKQRFNKVVVLINATSAMEIDSLKTDPEIDSVVWIGLPGAYGFLGVSGVLSGRYSPSGKLPDTFAVDASRSPAAQNMGINVYANKNDINYTINSRYGVVTETTYAALNAVSYLIEAEGIYTGYKYYESRYYDQVKGVSHAQGTASSPWSNYQGEVIYPFGYGLSYTNFTQSLTDVSVNIAQKKVTATVRVTNTGDVKGKDVVQLYYQSPYTQYDKTYLVEKSAIELLDFAKTSELDPGEFEDITIVADMQYMASYDANRAKTYILDYGTYYFGIGDNAHDALNNIMAKQNVTGMVNVLGQTASGTGAKVEEWVYSGTGEVDKTTFSKSKNGTDITNQLEDADWNYYEPGRVTHLSRNNWQSTFPVSYDNLSAPAGTVSGTKNMINVLRNDLYTFKTTGPDNGGFTFGATTGATFGDMNLADFDDPRWEEVLNRMTIGEMWINIAQGGNHNAPIESIGAPKVWQNDGPNGNGSSALGLRDIANTGANGDPTRPFYIADDDALKGHPLNTLPSMPVIAATFNKELAAETGKMQGNDGLWSNNAIIWSGGFNTHRTPYNGRNHEYYSEDPMLSNLLGTELIKESLKYGLIIGPKHFAFNDQDSNRYGIAPFMTEQKAREGDLRAFQGALENGALGVMTSFSRIGATHLNGHIGLMQNILRDEWGYKGLATTDMVNGIAYFQPKETIMGGVTMMAQSTKKVYTIEEAENFTSINPATYDLHWLYMFKQPSGEYFYSNDDVFLGQLRENWKYQLYALSNSMVINGNSATIPVKQWWKTGLEVASTSTAGLALFTSLLYGLFLVMDRKQ